MLYFWHWLNWQLKIKYQPNQSQKMKLMLKKLLLKTR